MEHPMLAVAEALGRKEDVVGRVAGDPASNDVDVGLLAGLEHTEVGVDGTQVGDDPRGSGARPVGSSVPR
jgi:hypothetical protein